MSNDPVVWIGQVVDYHNDPELVPIMASVDAAFENEHGSTFEHAFATRAHDGRWAKTWLSILQRTANQAVRSRYADWEDLGAPYDRGELTSSGCDAATARDRVRWAKAQEAAWYEAVSRWRFATANAIRDEYVTSMGQWLYPPELGVAPPR
jgi:hypothetical protein